MARLFLGIAILAISAGVAAAGSTPVHSPALEDGKVAGKSESSKAPASLHQAEAHAADAHPAGGHEDAHGAGGHHQLTQRGAPPINPVGPGTAFLHPSPELIVWTMVLFCIVFFVLKSAVWAPVLHALEHREHAIAESLRKAEVVREEAKKLLEQHDEYMTQAHDKAKQILEAARAEAAKEGEAILSQARTESAAAQSQAQSDIDAAKAEAIAELKGSLAGVTASMANRLTNRSFDTESARKWVEEVGK